MSDWDERVAAVWERVDAMDADELCAALDALGAERGEGDALALYERASARDFVGRADEAERLYRRALARRLETLDPRRAVEAHVQLASTLRVLGRAGEAIDLLAEIDLETLPQDRADWVRAFRALALLDAGRPAEAGREALLALAPHLTQYGRVIVRYVQDGR